MLQWERGHRYFCILFSCLGRLGNSFELWNAFNNISFRACEACTRVTKGEQERRGLLWVCTCRTPATSWACTAPACSLCTPDTSPASNIIRKQIWGPAVMVLLLIQCVPLLCVNTRNKLVTSISRYQFLIYFGECTVIHVFVSRAMKWYQRVSPL